MIKTVSEAPTDIPEELLEDPASACLERLEEIRGAFKRYKTCWTTKLTVSKQVKDCYIELVW